MTSVKIPIDRVYMCAHCDQVFSNPVKLGGHVHAQHPEHKRPVPKWLRVSRRAARPSLKRDSDTWPGRP